MSPKCFGANPVDFSQLWADIAFDAISQFLDPAAFRSSLLFTARQFGSVCTGLGTDHLILEDYLKPAVRRSSFARAHGLEVQLSTVMACDLTCVVSHGIVMIR